LLCLLCLFVWICA